MIIESGIEAATNADILAGTRLNAIPYNGSLTFDILANLNDNTNFWSMTIQLPNGDVPIDAQLVPGANPAVVGSLDERQLFRATFKATQGGHFSIALTESGTAVVYWRAVLSP